MATIATHTIVKNGADFIELCLRQVIPFVDRVDVAVSRHSTDGTPEIIKRLTQEFPKVEMHPYSEDDLEGLTKVRNRQLDRTEEDYIWILDDDEYYLLDDVQTIVNESLLDKHDVYQFAFWLMWDCELYHVPRSRIFTSRVIKNFVGLRWDYPFGNETLFVKGIKVDDEYFDIHQSPIRYVHFSMLKKNSWRKEYDKPYNIDGTRNLRRLPPDIRKEVKLICEKKGLS